LPNFVGKGKIYYVSPFCGDKITLKIKPLQRDFFDLALVKKKSPLTLDDRSQNPYH